MTTSSVYGRGRRIALRGTVLLLTAAIAACGDGTAQQPEEAPRLLGGMAKASAQQAAEHPLIVAGLEKVSETRVSRTTFDYAFKVVVRSTSAAHGGVRVVVTAVGKGSTIIAGSLVIGQVAAGATVSSTGTVVVRHDRTYPFDQAAMKFEVSADVINGVPVPADPGSFANDSVAGIDGNGNGVRDEVERALALSYGDDPKLYAAALSAAAVQQRWLASGASTETQAQDQVMRSMSAGRCLRQNFPKDGRSAWREISLRTFNTKARMATRQAVLDRAGAFELPSELPPC